MKYIFTLVVLCVLVGVASAWGASMGAWDCRKEITVNNTGTELTNYQVMFTVNRSAGSDSGFTVFLDGKCAEDYDDIRFTTSDEETLCDYWIESSSSTVASVWVEVPTITGSVDTTLYLYYGNAAASAVSDGDATFPLFDHFEGDTLDTDKWDIETRHNGYASGSITVSGGSLLIRPGSTSYYACGIISKANIPTSNLVVHYRIKTQADYATVCTGNAYQIGSGSSEGTGYTVNHRTSAASRLFVVSTQTLLSSSLKQLTANTWARGLFRYDSSGNWRSLIDATGATGTNTTDLSTDKYLCLWGLRTTGSTGNADVDWVFVINYTSTEPTVSAWGSEEQFPKYLTVDFSGVPTSGYVPLTVYFTDASVGYNVALDTWAWSFGDTSQNSTQQDPAHTYTTSGLYNVILTVTNTSFSKTNTTQKTAYINVTVNPDAPTPTPTTPTPTTTPTSTYVSTGYISVDSKGIDFILWKLSDANTTQIYVDGELQNISGLYYGQYGLLPNTPHTACLNSGECLTTNTNIDGFSVFWYWIVFIILIVLVVISYKIPITYVPTLIYGIYLIVVYLPSIFAGFNEYIIVGILLVMGIIATIQRNNLISIR